MADQAVVKETATDNGVLRETTTPHAKDGVPPATKTIRRSPVANIFYFLRPVNIYAHIPRNWFHFWRALQWIFAATVIAMLGTTLEFDDSRYIHPPLIALLFTACFTLVYTTPFVNVLYRHDPRVLLVFDGLCTLLWGCSFAAFAGVVRVSSYSYREGMVDMKRALLQTGGVILPRQHGDDVRLVPKHHRMLAWRTSLAATYFGAAELGLFIISTLVIAYNYHIALVDPTLNVPMAHDVEAQNGTTATTRTATGATGEPGDRLTVQHDAPMPDNVAGHREPAPV